MGKKYIIELEDEPFCQEDGNFVYKVKGFNNIVFSMMDFGGLGTLTPYTEPDLEQVRKEAYEQGQKDLRESCVPQDEEAYGIGYNEGFQCGIDVTWDAARKIENLPEAEKFEIFGEYDMFHIMRRYTATEAIKKLKAYEQEKEEIQVGDEIIYCGLRCVVMKLDEKGNIERYFMHDGTTFHNKTGFQNSDVKKTGRTFPEIAEVLRKMGEN